LKAQLRVAENPALQLILQKLRDKRTPRPMFRSLLRLAGLLLAYEAAPLLPTRSDTVETPLGVRSTAEVVDDSRLAVIAVLRAAIPMAMGVLDLYPEAELGFVAASRLEDTGRLEGGRIVFDVSIPYWKTPRIKGKHVIIVDPMLATGSTLSRVVSRVAEQQPEGITVLSLIATRQGVEAVVSSGENVSLGVIVGSLDPELNDKGFIVPGLGDAGDRCFGEAV